MPIWFRGLILKVVVYLINRLSSLSIRGKSSYEILFCNVTSLTHLRVIGCKCYAIIIPKGDKFSERENNAVLMGYFLSQKGHLLIDVLNNKTVVAMNVMFQEDSFTFVGKPTSNSPIDLLMLSTSYDTYEDAYADPQESSNSFD